MNMWVRAGQAAGTRLRDLLPQGRRKDLPGARPLSLALQGGGSFGAFTWGVLDRLLESDGVALDMISGVSAGAVNAVLLAAGLAEGGPAARASGWSASGGAPAPLSSMTRHVTTGTAALALDLSTRVLSPYQFNPLGLNPLRGLLAEEVDFARLRRASPIRLLIGATRVKDGRLRLFRDDEITLDVVLASTCLPQLHHAVEVEGEWYWDGGFSANPPLRQLVLDSAADDVALVQITPEEQEGVPASLARHRPARQSDHLQRRRCSARSKRSPTSGRSAAGSDTSARGSAASCGGSAFTTSRPRISSTACKMPTRWHWACRFSCA